MRYKGSEREIGFDFPLNKAVNKLAESDAERAGRETISILDDA